MRKFLLVLPIVAWAADAYATPPPGRRNFYAAVTTWNGNLFTYHDSGYSGSWSDPSVSPFGYALGPWAVAVASSGFLEVAAMQGDPYGNRSVTEAWMHTFAPTSGAQVSHSPPYPYAFGYSPALVRTGSDIVELFQIGTYPGTLLHSTIDHTSVPSGASMTSWESWGSPPPGICSAPAATSWGPGRLDVFVRGCDNLLWHIWQSNGTRGPWDNNWAPPSGHTLTGDPSASSWGDQRIDVWMRDTNGQILQAYYDHGAAGFQTWGNPNGVTFTSVGTAAFSVGEVYFGGLDQQSPAHVWLYRWANGPSSWEDLGPVPSGSDSASAVRFAGTAY